MKSMDDNRLSHGYDTGTEHGSIFINCDHTVIENFLKIKLKECQKTGTRTIHLDEIRNFSHFDVLNGESRGTTLPTPNATLQLTDADMAAFETFSNGGLKFNAFVSCEMEDFLVMCFGFAKASSNEETLATANFNADKIYKDYKDAGYKIIKYHNIAHDKGRFYERIDPRADMHLALRLRNQPETLADIVP